jgi:gluconolactonase
MIFVKGLGAPETPRLLPTDKSWLCVEMAPPRNGVTHISRDGSVIEQVAPVPCPNGLMPDQDGVIWVANTVDPPSLMRVTLDGDVEIAMDAVEGKPMLLPNDFAFGPDGSLYMTDSGMVMGEWVVDGAIRPDYLTADYDGRVYRFDLAAGTGRIIDDGIRFTNGIALGPEGDLYVTEMISGDILRYPFSGVAPTSERQVFANVMSPDWAGGFHGPDGMNFGADGRLYCTVYGEGCIAVIGRDGKVEERLATEGSNPANVAWGPDGDTHIYVTEHELGQIERLETTTTALPLYYGGSEPVRL